MLGLKRSGEKESSMVKKSARRHKNCERAIAHKKMKLVTSEDWDKRYKVKGIDLFHEQGDVIDRSFYKTIASMHFLNWHRRIFRSGSGRARRFLNSREGGEVGLPARAIGISSFFPQTHL